jgi:transmembrane 9 superfamily protein 1
VLDGDRMAKSMYNIKFRENQDTVTLCKVTLNEKDLDKLKSAIEDLYYFEFVAGVCALKITVPIMTIFLKK